MLSTATGGSAVARFGAPSDGGSAAESCVGADPGFSAEAVTVETAGTSTAIASTFEFTFEPRSTVVPAVTSSSVIATAETPRAARGASNGPTGPLRNSFPGRNLVDIESIATLLVDVRWRGGGAGATAIGAGAVGVGGVA